MINKSSDENSKNRSDGNGKYPGNTTKSIERERTFTKADIVQSSPDCGTMTRDDLEDKFHKLSEENIMLKKHLRKQEEKIKQLATKLVRFVGDRKNKEKRDDILIEEQKSRISELEYQCSLLRDKLQVTRSQLSSCTKLCPNYNAVSSASSAARLSRTASQIRKSPRYTASSSSHRPTEPKRWEMSEHVEQLLLEAKGENQALEEKIKLLRSQLSLVEKELESTKDQCQLNEMKHQEEILRFQTQMESESNQKKKKLSDNIHLIRLQRDSRRTSSWLSTLETQCRSLEASLSSAGETIQQLECQLSTTQDELREERQKHLTVQKELEEATSQLHENKEIGMRLNALQEENAILKETNESLVSKTFSNAEKLKKVEFEDSSLKSKITQLEASLKTEVKAKADLFLQLSQEKGKTETLESTIQRLSEKIEELKIQSQEQSHGPNVEEQCEKCKELESDLNQTQWQLVQVRDELGKTKSLLRTQMTINNDYQKEIESLSVKLEKAETFHHEKLQDFMQILEQRAEQMAGLEKSLEELRRERDHTNPTTE